VVAEGRRIGDYVLIQIEDRGLGMAPEQMNALNERLSEPPTVDVAAFRMMGLAVVSRLASRYRIKVELRPNPDGGTITHVTLPTGVLVLPRLRGREPVLSRPRSPLAVEQGMAGGPNGWPMPQLPGLAATAASTGVITVDRPSSFGAPAATVPTVDALGYATGPQQRMAPPDANELPIYRSMEAVWFGGTEPAQPRQPAPNQWTPPAPRANSGSGGPPPASGPPPANGPAPSGPPLASASARPYVSGGGGNPPYVPPGAQPPPVPPIPPPGSQREEGWSTTADLGWQAAAAASEPQNGGTTRSGLPKRVPAAQLVPGAVDAHSTTARAKRSPDDVRGLLSAYHRGVQRGRSGAEGSSLGPRPDPEERHR
jgi:hypothetical protein